MTRLKADLKVGTTTPAIHLPEVGITTVASVRRGSYVVPTFRSAIRTTFRSLLAVGCLALLAACSPQTYAVGDAAKIKAGIVWGNCHSVIDPALPFGGYKQSGIGREQAREGVEAYTELKTVVIAL